MFPCYHLVSPSRHRESLIGYALWKYPCAITGAPGLDYLSPRRLQGHVRSVFAYPLPANGGLSLRPGSNVLFPFVADGEIIIARKGKSTHVHGKKRDNVIFLPSNESLMLKTMEMVRKYVR